MVQVGVQGPCFELKAQLQRAQRYDKEPQAVKSGVGLCVSFPEGGRYNLNLQGNKGHSCDQRLKTCVFLEVANSLLPWLKPQGN